jgi:hypothetical protein
VTLDVPVLYEARGRARRVGQDGYRMRAVIGRAMIGQAMIGQAADWPCMADRATVAAVAATA